MVCYPFGRKVLIDGANLSFVGKSFSLFGVYVNLCMDVLIPWKRRRACGSISRAEGACVGLI